MTDIQRAYPPSDLEQAAQAFGAPARSEHDRRAELTGVTDAMVQSALSDAELDALVTARAIDRGSRGKRRMTMRQRVGVLASATALGLSPEGQAATNWAVDSAQAAVADAVNAANNILDNDRTVNPDQGNPPEAEDIVNTWNSDSQSND